MKLKVNDIVKYNEYIEIVTNVNNMTGKYDSKHDGGTVKYFIKRYVNKTGATSGLTSSKAIVLLRRKHDDKNNV